MEILFAMWLLMAGIERLEWGSAQDHDGSVPEGAVPGEAGEVVAAEGPVAPPPPKP